MPVIVRDRTVVTFADVANVRRSFEDPQGFARIDGQPALALEGQKRNGWRANIIETVDGVRGAVDATEAGWPGQYQRGLHASTFPKYGGTKCSAISNPTSSPP